MHTQTITSNQALKDVAQMLKPSLGDFCVHEAKLLLMHVLGVDRTALLNSKLEIKLEHYEQLIRLSKLRQSSMPLAKITGIKEFWSLPFTVTTDTLDPRPDSETLIETILDHKKDKHYPYKILDLGTGSGCLILSLLHEYQNATGLAVDKSKEALKIASENGQKFNLSDRVTFHEGNWCEGLNEEYEIIITNPPYISNDDYQQLDPTVKEFEPLSALVSGPSGLEDYKKIISTVDKSLANDGIFAIEIGINQEQDVSNILTEYGFTTLEIRNDLAGIPRCVLACK